MINIMNYNISLIRFKFILNLRNIYKFLANYYITEKNLNIEKNNNFKILRGYVSRHIKNLLNIDKKTEQRKYKCLFRIKFLIEKKLIIDIGELVRADLNITYISEIDSNNFNLFIRKLGNNNEMTCDINEEYKLLIVNNVTMVE
jgi:hypothetical protein